MNSFMLAAMLAFASVAVARRTKQKTAEVSGQVEQDKWPWPSPAPTPSPEGSPTPAVSSTTTTTTTTTPAVSSTTTTTTTTTTKRFNPNHKGSDLENLLFRCETLPTFDPEEARISCADNLVPFACFSLTSAQYWACFDEEAGDGGADTVDCNARLLPETKGNGTRGTYDGACVYARDFRYGEAQDAFEFDLKVRAPTSMLEEGGEGGEEGEEGDEAGGEGKEQGKEASLGSDPYPLHRRRMHNNGFAHRRRLRAVHRRRARFVHRRRARFMHRRRLNSIHRRHMNSINRRRMTAYGSTR